MTSGDDNRGYNQARETKTRDSGVSSTRAIREKLEAQFGGQFSSKLAKEYERLTPEQREGMEGMTENEAKRELREAGRKREKLEETMRNTEPAWKSDPVKEKPESRRLRTEDMIDTGSGDILVHSRDREPEKKVLDPEIPDVGGGPTGGVWRTFSTCDSGTITVWCQS